MVFNLGAAPHPLKGLVSTFPSGPDRGHSTGNQVLAGGAIAVDLLRPVPGEEPGVDGEEATTHRGADLDQRLKAKGHICSARCRPASGSLPWDAALRP